MTAASYPASPAERTRWILERRGTRNDVSAEVAYAVVDEEELSADGRVAPVTTVFLTNRECPWKCVMCDLWRNTTVGRVEAGAIPKQIRAALGSRKGGILKLYNSGSFFDDGAIPKRDWPEIAELCSGFEQVIVESHPALIGEPVLEWAKLLDAKLEVALGLETANPEALEAINKRTTPEAYRRATKFLVRAGIYVRTFLLVNPPFIKERAQEFWMKRSIEFAFAAGSSVVSLIPTRAGNGAMDALGLAGLFREPDLSELEAAQEYGIALRRGRVFADLWDLKRFAHCTNCADARSERLHRMNLSQNIERGVACSTCGHGLSRG